MRDWTHRRLLANYLQTIGITVVAFLLVASAIAWFTSWEFAAFLTSFGSLAAWVGIPHGYRRFCAKTRIEAASIPGPEFQLLPWVSATGPISLVILAVCQFPDTSIVTISLAAAGLGFAWAVFSGCKAIASASSAV